jgi:uncharacterized protein (DUF1015 family)
MAEVRPFKGMYYDPSRVDVQKVVTQPWDVITPEMQDRYYETDPHNIVRIVRGKEMPGDDGGDNKFTRAGKYFRDWLAEGLFIRDNADSIYLYTQKFRLGDSELTRRGFIAAVKLEDYESRVILPHEHTFPKHNLDRLHLVRETKANFGQIFVLYPDPEMTMQPFLAQFQSKPHLFSVTAEGVTHIITRIADPTDINFIVEQMKDKQLFIADGHHRYQTALNYRDEMLPKLPKSARRDVCYRMMTLISMDDPSVTILPAHRLLRSIPSFGSDEMLRQIKKFFNVRKVKDSKPDLQNILRELRSFWPARTAFVVCLPKSEFLLITLKDRASTLEAMPENLHPTVRELDVTVLHSLVLGKILSLTHEHQHSGEHIRYFRDPAEPVRLVQRGEGQVAFLLNPTRVQQVMDVALAGEVMPHKSTDFYPKLLTGLIIRKLDI